MLHFPPTGHFFFLLHRVARVGRFFARWLAATRWPKRQNGSNVRLPEISRRSERRFGLDLSPGPISVRCRRKSFVFVETGFGQKPTQDRLDLEPPFVLRRASPGPEVCFRSWRETSKRNGWGELPATILSWKNWLLTIVLILASCFCVFSTAFESNLLTNWGYRFIHVSDQQIIESCLTLAWWPRR